MEANNSPVPWYKVPVMWLVVSILTFTVVASFGLMGFAHSGQDGLVVEQGMQPLSKKQALQENKKISDHPAPEGSEDPQRETP